MKSIPFALPTTHSAEKPTSPNFLRAVLKNIHDQGQSPGIWINLLTQYDPGHRYVITQAFHYRDLSPGPDFLQEYVIMVAQPRPDKSETEENFFPAPIVVKVSRSINRHTRAARLGLSPSLSDTITVLGALDDVRAPMDGCMLVDTLVWSPHHDSPRLWDVSFVIDHLGDALSQRRLLKPRSSCRHFARAVFKTVERVSFGLIDGKDPREVARRAAASYWSDVWGR